MTRHIIASRVVVIALMVSLLEVRPASAQIPTIDAANLVQLVNYVKTAYDMVRTGDLSLAHWVDFSGLLGPMAKYRTRTVGIAAHDLAKYPYGRAILQGWNLGDPRGVLYEQAIAAIPTLVDLMTLDVGPQERATIERHYGRVQIDDSLMQRGIELVGANRVFSGDLDKATQALEDDVVRESNKEHHLSASLDKATAAGLLGRRYDTQSNQLLAGVVEHLANQTLRDRDSETEWLNAMIRNQRYGPLMHGAMQAGASDALENWRTP